MGGHEERKRKKQVCIGLLAHVDAGKTTLAEQILYTAGEIRSAGRVDHGDTFLDTDAQERERGITIFSKQARFSWKGAEATLLDTPGHVDFSAEMERTLQVLDCALLIVNGADGVQSHTLTLWRLLERYRVPVFLFINKMDQPGTDKDKLLAGVQKELDSRCVSFARTDQADADEIGAGGERDGAFYENIAMCDESLLEKYLERMEERRAASDLIRDEEIAELIAQRRLFPCFFGSALKGDGVAALLDALFVYAPTPDHGETFGARVFKISRDAQGNRLTHIKVTGGSLKVKQTIQTTDAEKIDQIRQYSGERYEAVQEVAAGSICALLGPEHTFCGQGLGAEEETILPLLEPVMTYRVNPPEGLDIHDLYIKLCKLEEEEPLLHPVRQEQSGELHVRLMGEVQIEILRKLILERFGMEVTFDEGSVLYQETIADVAEGVGHFEPLRHYAEVHLILEPGERGSGLVFKSCCSEDDLDRNWQRLILTHLAEKAHPGVLTGSPITDMQITLAAGKAHVKHTEGGDFRQATYRAVRQGLCRAKSVLLEPIYAFRMELPASLVGRAMTDIQAMCGHFEAPETVGEEAVLTGTVPVSEFGGYQSRMLAYTAGKGRLFTTLKGYEPCHNAEEVIDRIGYEAEHDTENPCGSVFCAHGAGFVVEWDRVEDYMHLEPALKTGWKLADGSIYGLNDQNGQRNSDKADSAGGGDAADKDDETGSFAQRYAKRAAGGRSTIDFIGQDEVEEIFARTYGTKESKKQGWARTIRAKTPPAVEVEYRGGQEKRAEYLLVDGYNIIFAWEELSELAKSDLNAARGRLMDLLSNFQGFRKINVILVFDAYRVKGNPGSVEHYHNIDVVYTKEAETADQYIEKVTRRMSGKNNHVRVATSDGLEQIIILGAGAIRVSARELYEEVQAAQREMREYYKG
ncbi:MAG: TetM/TetW/TetO/TetS family tetracycline resistance ribosomal protection protein [Bacteroidales bacterium]|nr:TetM/TetW/TetO/TetS family tetracycline resistance ribosomal protection protein [Bacteroidales bacterium]MCM1416266.1 TetM/TetW/TetO/TetS family tetracycline resistance ribosomal protection protein [bacterium]MCM1422378.1 TetM/TetW/TetO/TetS family tetracycline resistance ribosomal protection protein [bacterium]